MLFGRAPRTCRCGLSPRRADCGPLCIPHRMARMTAFARPLEEEIVAKDGQKRIVIGSEVSLSGALEGEHLIVLFDVSERARSEQLRRDLDGHLRQLQKMEAIGTFAGSLAHDFNNIMNAIL